jgi:protein gp37
VGDTKIEWTEKTWNPIRARNLETGGVGHFCEIVSSGCSNCYAQRMQPRFGNKIRYNKADRDKVEIFLDEKVLLEPLRWRKPCNIFVCSMTDLFGEFHSDEWLDKVFAVMALTPQHTYQVLTKRPERMMEYLRSDDLTRWGVIEGNAQRIHYERTGEDPSEWLAVHGPLPNVWLGVSVEDQKTADERIPILLQTPAAVRWLSIEPLLGPVNLSRWLVPWNRAVDHSGAFPSHILTPRHDGIFPIDCECGWSNEDDDQVNWVVVGGESGPDARPMHPDWVRSIRDQCQAAGVPFFFKQWGEWWPISQTPDGWSDEHPRYAKRSKVLQLNGDDIGLSFPPGAMTCFKVGKNVSGRILDGREWNEMPVDRRRK